MPKLMLGTLSIICIYVLVYIYLCIIGYSRSITCSPSNTFTITFDLLAADSQPHFDEAEKWVWNGGRYWSKELAIKKLDELGRKHYIVVLDKGTTACFNLDSTWTILTGKFKGKKLWVITDPTLIGEEEGVNL